MKKKNIIICIISFAILILVLLFVFKKNKVNEPGSLLYTIIYSNKELNIDYKVAIYENMVETSETIICKIEECEPQRSIKNQIYYSQENMKKIHEFSKQELEMKNNSTKVVDYDKLTTYQQRTISSFGKDEYTFELNVEKYKYKFSYEESNKREYHFYFKYDNTILVKRVYKNDKEITKIKTYDIDFKEEYKNKLFDYAQKHNEYHKTGKLYKNETNIYMSLIKNRKSYLKKDIISLEYEIMYNGINCLTPYIRLYSDKSYEYYYGYSKNGSQLLHKNGIYDYDISKIIDSIGSHVINEAGPYIIKEKESKDHITYNTNKELMNFFNKYEFNLNRCLSNE